MTSYLDNAKALQSYYDSIFTIMMVSLWATLVNFNNVNRRGSTKLFILEDRDFLRKLYETSRLDLQDRALGDLHNDESGPSASPKHALLPGKWRSQRHRSAALGIKRDATQGWESTEHIERRQVP